MSSRVGGLSAEDHKERLRLHSIGLNDREISENIGITPSSVSAWRRKNNLPRNRSIRNRDKDKEKMELYEAGYSNREIGRRLGLHESTISHWRKRRGLTLKQARKIGMAEREKIREGYKAGLSSRAIADKLGVCPQTVNLWLIRLELRKKGEARSARSVRTREEVAAIYDMNKAGYLDKDIAKKLGRSGTFVGDIRKQLGLKANWNVGDGLREYHNRDEVIAFKQKVINLYHKNPAWDWDDIVNAVDLEVNAKNLTKVKILIGNHLMKVCRSQEACAFKPLLPENVERGGILNE